MLLAPALPSFDVANALDSVLFRELRQAFILDGHTASGRLKAHSTLNTEKRNCRIHLSHFDKYIAKDIRSRQIKDWLWKQSAGLQSKLRNTLSAIYRFGRVEGLVPAYCDPVKDVGASALSTYEAVDVGPKRLWRSLMRSSHHWCAAL